MKLYILAVCAVILSLSLVIAGPTTSINIIGDGGDPIYTETDFSPLVFLNQEQWGRVLNNEVPWTFPGDDGNIEIRDNNYAFTGEQIQWKVLVWDKNGVPEKIHDVFAGWVDQQNGPLDPEAQVNCEFYTGEWALQDGDNLLENGYPSVMRPGDQEPQETFNDATMGEYLCTLTIEPSCHGQKWLGVKAIDIDGNNGTMQEAESWFCNPELDLFVSGDINFGELGPGEQAASTFSVENAGEAGSGVEVVLAIAGTDFFDPSSSGALCPITNKLDLQGVEDPSDTIFQTGFWYSAVMGSHSTSDVAPNPLGLKRIPYLISAPVSGADPLFSTSDSADDWRRWHPSEIVPMSPGSEASVTLHLGIPQPCTGQFTDGQISLFAWAV